jgi:hypothetical protein
MYLMHEILCNWPFILFSSIYFLTETKFSPMLLHIVGPEGGSSKAASKYREVLCLFAIVEYSLLKQVHLV